MAVEAGPKHRSTQIIELKRSFLWRSLTDILPFYMNFSCKLYSIIVLHAGYEKVKNMDIFSTIVI